MSSRSIQQGRAWTHSHMVGTKDMAPVVKIECWRDGDWVLVALDGVTAWRRMTRDSAFTEARVCFSSSQSPSLPKSLHYFEGVELIGPRLARGNNRWSFHHRNNTTVPIFPERHYVPPLQPHPECVTGCYPRDVFDDFDDL